MPKIKLRPSPLSNGPVWEELNSVRLFSLTNCLFSRFSNESYLFIPDFQYSSYLRHMPYILTYAIISSRAGEVLILEWLHFDVINLQPMYYKSVGTYIDEIRNNLWKVYGFTWMGIVSPSLPDSKARLFAW